MIRNVLSCAAAAGALMLAVAASAQSVAADTPEKTAAGATFTLPKGWSVVTSGAVMIARPPEADTRAAIVEVGPAKDSRDAAAHAWALYRPEARRTPKLVTAQPAREGWDERAVLDYETSPNEKAVVEVFAERAGPRWTVLIVDAAEATAEKRQAALYLILQSLRPAGYARESFAGRTAHRLDPGRVAAIKSFVQTAMSQLGVPGVGLALIDHGQAVFEGGLGVKELGKADPVDAHTLFAIASNTKGMSTLLLAEQVDAGKVRWDEKVTDVYPNFRLGSPETTSKVLIRHLVCACTGLPRKDYDWIFNTPRGTPASATFTQLAATEPTSGFGEVFQYNNLMASAAGYIAGHLSYPDRELGAAYDAAMRKDVFDPLGMADTTFDFAKALGGDHASPHADDIDGRPAIASQDLNDAVIPYRPAGGAWSSAHDMIRYVEDEITEGVLPSGKRLVSAANLLARRSPGVPIGEDASYGMGLMNDLRWGVRVVHHGGSLTGYKSDIMLVPDAKVGAVILTNSDEGQLMLRPFMRRLLEVLYDGQPQAAGDVAAAAKAHLAEIAAERPRLQVPPAAGAVAALAGAYLSPELGRLTVEKSGASLRFQFVTFASEMASRKNDDGTLSFVTIDPGLDGFAFVVGKSTGGARTLTVRDGQHEYVFTEAR